MKKLVQIVAIPCTLFVLAFAASANPAQQQQSKGAPVQQAKYKGARVAPPSHQSVHEIYQNLMKQQPTQQASQGK